MEYDIVIIGGGVAGLTAGLYSARSGATTLVLEENYIGGTTASLELIENYPGYDNISGMELVNKIYMQALNFGAEIQIAKIIKIDFTEKKIETSIGEISYKALILATGSTYKKLNVSGEEELSQKGISYCAVCDGALYKNKKIVVVTDDYSASSAITYLSNLTKDITILDINNKYKNTNYTVYNNVDITSINGNEFVESISFNCDNIAKNIECLGVFINIGKVHNTGILNGQIDTKDGFIVTNIQLETNINCVFAIGDIRYNSTKQIVCACADGATAALNAIKKIKK